MIKITKRVVLQVTMQLDITFTRSAKEYCESDSFIHGCANSDTRSMWVKPTEPVFVWIHEWAHILLQHNQRCDLQQLAELEAELESDVVALLVYKHFGITAGKIAYMAKVELNNNKHLLKYLDMDACARTAAYIVKLIKEATQC